MHLKSLFLLGAIAVIVLSCGPEKKAIKNFKAVKYQSVIDYYKKTLARNPGNGRANYFVAESYRLSNRIGEAEQYYPKASGRGIDRDSMMFYYSQALKANGKYPEAKKILRQARRIKRLRQRQGKVLMAWQPSITLLIRKITTGLKIWKH